ncbi:Syntaxin of plants 7 (Syp7) [Monocercomonoides exilis]|uniref:Syntaxin of plants 7 (Syp7) n=1 Tax=Monocercomonoides exilis TaxID=2049356 RepID=UPI0035599104|nr:Syntaxin of plants 7 (Syp7) [Monocercomonoides exilis]|eukprot:MONOS_4113.1-p1 / transcript=MONOS_4113.1 / gene=MONOS_4113 / organism=Monocercomonoides_exilis_PA203 / gene_product= Syntaxin of plants 7 (Syp7) / transcript_product= Syntaxin of plants 7 (Syp7) / location=Mono_scaffold00105:16947-18473(+) / protein_length=308 / sequence_SO=supercontig / SO=protein_coding / is_pseudo=false
MSSNGVAGGSAQLKKAIRELDNMERRLNYVVEKCLSPEELEKRRNDRFGTERKRLLSLLTRVREDLIQRDKIVAKQGKNADSIQLNARCRRDLADAQDMLKYLEKDVSNTEKKFGDSKDPKKKKLLAQKQAGLDNARDFYQICQELFDAGSGEGASTSRSELMRGIEMTQMPSSSSSSSSISTKGGIHIDPNNFTAVSQEPSAYEDQWQQLLQREEEIEDQYLEVIEGNISVLKELATAMGDELDKQDVMLDSLDDHMSKTNSKIEQMNKTADKVQSVANQSNRCLYIVIIVIIIIIVGFLLIQFVF